MEAKMKAAREGIAQYNWADSLPNNMGKMLFSVDANGNAVMMPAATITDPTMAAAFQGEFGTVPAPSKGTGKPPVINPGTGTGSGSEKPPPAAPTTVEGAPPGTFPNPATGSYEPLQGQPATPPEKPSSEQPPGHKVLKPPTAEEMGRPQASVATPSNMYAATGPQPPGPESFQGPTQEQTTQAIQEATQRNQFASTQPGVPAGYQSPQQKQQLADWQAQNAHPVAAAGDALAWAKKFHTGYTDATYLPHGGPGGEPAFAFTEKGGGTNTVPLSQMVRNGFGPTVAAQSTSSVLSVADQAQQGPQGPGLPLGPVSPAQPSQQPQPPPAQAPAAPSQGITDIYGNPLSAYTSVASKGGPTPQQLTAQTAPAGQPAEPPPGQPVRNPHEPLSGPTADTTLSSEEQRAIQEQAAAMPPRPEGKYTGDRVVEGTRGPYTYYINDDPYAPKPYRGRAYTVLPGSAGGYFNQKRWYLGTNHYEEYELPDSEMKKTMFDKWGRNGYLSKPEIDAMDAEEMKPWLQRAWQNENYTRSSPTEGINSDLDSMEQLHNYIKKISDLEQTLAENGYPNLNTDHRMVAAAKNASVSLGNRHLSEMAGVDKMDAVSAATIRTLDQTVNQARDFLKDHPKLLLNPGQGGGQETPNIRTDWFHLGLPDIPASTILSDSAFSGQNINTRLRMVNGLLKLVDNRYGDLADQAHTQWMKISPKHDANKIKIDQGRDLNDPTNSYTRHLHIIDNTDDYLEFKENHPNTRFLGPDGIIRRTPPASGT
jgi:hypothetical protein